jgi:hypothetical protein
MIGYRGVTAASPEWGSVQSIDLPGVPGAQVDDLLVAFLAIPYAATLTVPTGMTEFWQALASLGEFDAGQPYRLECYSKRVTAEPEPETYTWSVDAGGIAGVCVGLGSVDLAGRIESYGLAQATSDAPIAPSIHVASEGTLMLVALAAPDHAEPDPGPVGEPMGFARRLALFDWNTFVIADAAVELGGRARDTGPKPFGALSSSSAWIAFSLGLLPAVFAGTARTPQP